MNINFDDAIKLMQELKTPYVRVTDARDKKIVEFVDVSNVESTIEKLKEFRNALDGYGIINIIAADEKILKANWQNPFIWRVSMARGSNAITGNQQANNFPHHTGYVSQREAELTAQLEALKMQMQFQNQIDLLTRKLEDKGSSDFTQYIPLAALALKIPANEVAAMMGLVNQQRPQGIAGNETQAQPKLLVQMTVEEEKEKLQKQLDNITTNISNLIKEVGVDKVEKLVVGIAAKPNMVDTALTFL
jgi:hypothetical protein